MVRPAHHITEIGLQAQQPLAVLTINIMFFLPYAKSWCHEIAWSFHPNLAPLNKTSNIVKSELI
jgi:hypothetical protein